MFLKISLNTPAHIGDNANTNYSNIALSVAEKRKYFEGSGLVSGHSISNHSLVRLSGQNNERRTRDHGKMNEGPLSPPPPNGMKGGFGMSD